MILKAGVSLRGLQPQALVILQVAEAVYRGFDVPLVVTSASDGEHSTDSLHYAGLAIDLRTKNIPTVADKGLIRREIAQALGQEFDVLLEYLGAQNEHLHAEYDP